MNVSSARATAQLALFLLLLAVAAGCSKKHVTRPVTLPPAFPAWTSLGGPSTANVRALASPGGSTLVAGTDAGIWRSTDAGATWSRVDGATVNAMTVDPAGVLYAGTSLGVLRSADGGANWSDFSAGLVPGTSIVSIVVSGGTVLAAVARGPVIAYLPSADHWTDASAGIPPGAVVSALGLAGGTIAIAGTEAGQEFEFDGSSWHASADPAPNHPVIALYSATGVPTFTGTRDFGIYVNGVSAGLPANTSAYGFIRWNGADFAGTNHQIYSSTNAGVNWSQVPTPVTDGTPITSFAPAGTSLFAGTAGYGVLSSGDGATWSTTGPPDAHVTAILQTPGNITLAGTARGILWSLDGQHWNVASLDSGSIACFVAKGTTFLAGTLGNGIARSTDGGVTWSDASTGLPAGSGVFRLVTDGTAILANLLADPTGLYRSLDDGVTWTPVTTLANHQNVTDLTVLGGRIFAGEFGATGGVFVSVDHGDTWAPANGAFLAGKTVTAIGAGGIAVYAATTDGVFLSEDDGASWRPTLAPVVVAKEIAVHGEAVAIVATDGTVIRTKDAGENWDRQTPFAHVFTAAAGNTAFILGTDAGAWKSDY